MEKKNNTSIIVKKFPKVFKKEDIKEFLLHFGADDIEVYKHFSFARFKHEEEAQYAIRQIHQKEILGSRLQAEYAKDKILDPSTSVKEEREWDTNDKVHQNFENLNDYVKQLYAMNHHLNFSQSPLPYLKYKYPKPTRDIIDSICVALESIPKFYTQVLHLMNRMNLPTPFNPPEKGYSSQLPEYCDRSQQTDAVAEQFQQIVAGTTPHYVEKDDDYESEIELENEQYRKEIIPELKSLKRKSTINMKNQAKKFRSIIDNEKNRETKLATRKIDYEMFEKIEMNPGTKITLKLPDELKTTSETPETHIVTVNIEEVPRPPTEEFVTLTDKEIADNRLDSEQMKFFPVFKDYHIGLPSNKLYIKNLAKTVTEEDLKRLYFRYFEENSDDIISIKLMQSGRMKGQAFITFKLQIDETDDDLDEDKVKVEYNRKLIKKALSETNGYILKDKPMVVLYGKKQ